MPPSLSDTITSSYLDMKNSQDYPSQDLEGCSPTSTIAEPPLGRLRQHLRSQINSKHTDHVLLFCWFTTGLLDSTIFNAYRTFVSMQTGNTMFLGLGASNYNTTTRPYGWAKSLISLICFVAGAIFFSRLHKFLPRSISTPSRRTLLSSSFLIQAAIILLTALLVQVDVIEGRLEYIGEDIDWIHVLPIALLSFQAPGQVWLTRELKFAEVSTVVVSTMLYDFGSDKMLFWAWGRDGRDGKRERRFLGFAVLLVGAVVGGWVTKVSGHITIPMWVAGTLKVGIAVAWAVWPAEEEEERKRRGWWGRK